MSINVVLLDIEGTTSPISFTYEVLFPYARDRLQQFLCDHRSDSQVQIALQSLKVENVPDVQQGAPAVESRTEHELLLKAGEYCLWLMSRDRKSTPLKTIQGLIWEQGFSRHDLRGEVFEDVPAAFERWRRQGRSIAIYSSGSVLAQKLLFGHSQWGDLTPYISVFFDTRVGAKGDVKSYLQILQEVQRRGDELIFVSDVLKELNAAREAGLRTALSIRPGNSQSSDGCDHPTIYSFDELSLD
jgi:enolase-phosphatase E1